MTEKEIDIDELQVGMHVFKLDIPWRLSPFLFHKRVIKSQNDISALKKAGVKKLFIDTAKGNTGKEPSNPIDEEQPAQKPVTDDSASEIITPERSKPLDKEINTAKIIRRQFGKMSEGLFNSAESDVPVNSSDLLEIVDETLKSLSRNNQALVTLSHIKRKSEHLLEHTFSVFCMALGVGQLMQLPAEELAILGLAAVIHDAGWVSLPINLYKKETKYTNIESKIVEKHVNLLKTVISSKQDLSPEVMRIAQEVHECCDGSGYPRGIDGDEIHPLSKVLAVVDRYDELANGLGDYSGYTPNGALLQLDQMTKAGKLDNAVREQLVSLLGVFPAGSTVRLNTGEKALVIESHHHAPDLPTVKIFYSRRGMPMAPKIINLSRQKNMEQPRIIVEVLNTDDAKVDPANVLVLELD